MTFIGKHLPELVPFMEDTYSPQAVNQARNAFKKKVRKSSATFFYGAMCGFFTTDELDDLLFEASEVARFLLEVEGTTLDIDEEIDIEDRITKVMRGVGEAAKTLLKNRSEDEAAKDKAKNEDLAAIVSMHETPVGKNPDTPDDTPIPDTPITPAFSGPVEPEPVPETATGPAKDAGIPQKLPVPVKKPISPGSGESQGREDPVHTGDDTTEKDARTVTTPTDTGGEG